MEAVQQKVSQSQKLEDMEVNMDSFLQHQVKNKLGQTSARKSGTSSDSDSGKETLSRKISRTLFRK